MKHGTSKGIEHLVWWVCLKQIEKTAEATTIRQRCWFRNGTSLWLELNYTLKNE